MFEDFSAGCAVVSCFSGVVWGAGGTCGFVFVGEKVGFEEFFAYE